MSKVAICVTGGYYYNCNAGFGSAFYDWLNEFCNENNQFEPHIVSWRPEGAVPDKVKAQFKNIHYRGNHGNDWGCYNYFVNYLKDNDLKDEYEFIIFVHDDILTTMSDWPLVMHNHIVKNPQFDLTSFFGRYIQHPPEEFIKKSELYYTKEYMSMCFCWRANDYFFDNNPFVSVPGNVVDYCGDMGCAIVFANFLQRWGTEKLGHVCREGIDSRPEYFNAVHHFKRGTRLRNSPEHLAPLPPIEKAPNMPKVSFDLAVNYGWVFEPGKLATHPRMNEKNVILGWDPVLDKGPTGHEYETCVSTE